MDPLVEREQRAGDEDEDGRHERPQEALLAVAERVLLVRLALGERQRARAGTPGWSCRPPSGPPRRASPRIRSAGRRRASPRRCPRWRRARSARSCDSRRPSVPHAQRGVLLHWPHVTAAPEKLLLAAPRGYCAGVDRAVQTVERALELYGAPGLRAQGDRPQQARGRAAARARRDLRRGARRRRSPRARSPSSPPTASRRRSTPTPSAAACGRSTRPARSSPRSTARRSSSPPRATRSC